MDHEKCKLRNLFWEATLRCNAGCPFCGSRCGRQSELKEVDSGTLIKTFESIAGAYDAHSIMVNVTGGEPLLRKDLFSVMDKVHQLGFPWGIVTNASLITDETIQSMKKNGMRTISISIDDLFEAHERMRRLPGSFSHIVDSIHSLAQEDFLDTIQITTVVSRENIGSLEFESFLQQIFDQRIAVFILNVRQMLWIAKEGPTSTGCFLQSLQTYIGKRDRIY